MERGRLQAVKSGEIYSVGQDRSEFIFDFSAEDGVAEADMRGHIHIFYDTPRVWVPSLEAQVRRKLAGRQPTTYFDVAKITVNLNVIANTPEIHTELKRFGHGVAHWLDLNDDELHVFTRIRPREALVRPRSVPRQ